MSMPSLQRRTLALVAVIVPLLILLAYVAVRSGPLAPIAVTEARVESLAIRPALFGIGTIEARHAYRIGPTAVGRIRSVNVDVGDPVRAGQLLAEIDPLDLDDRLRAQQAAHQRAAAGLREAATRQAFAATQAQRYEQLLAARATSEEVLLAKRQELAIAEAALSAAREELARVGSERDALRAQRGNLRLLAPADGIVAARDAEPGVTVVAGQTVLEVIEPNGLWADVRFDQISAAGLAKGLPVRLQLRSRSGETLQGHVLRVEPKADAVTEEVMAKVAFDRMPAPLPAIGELVEATVDLPELPVAPVVPNAAVQRSGHQVGVWQISEEGLRFVAIRPGRADLDGRVQVLQGLKNDDRIVVYSEKALKPDSRIHVVERIQGAGR